MMDEKRFEELWQTAEAEGKGGRLATGYGAWRQRQRRIGAATAVVAVLLVTAVPLLTPNPAQDYKHVYCNRTGTTDAQWADLAETMLMESYGL